MSTPVTENPNTNALETALQPLLAPLVQEAVASASAALKADIATLQTAVAKNQTAIEDGLAKAGSKLLTNVEDDPVTQRIVVCAVVAALLLAGLIILVGAMLGNSTAKEWIAGVPIAIGSAVLWISKTGVSLPKPAAK
jgi:hypothetical protein